jgi:opacity protein-like surface antigen
MKKNKINYKLLASTTLVSLLNTSQVFSQTTNFTGPSLALTTSYIDTTNDIKTLVNAFSANKTTSTTLKKDNLIPGVDLNYGFATGNNLVIGLGATYDFSKTKSGKKSSHVIFWDNNQNEDGTQTVGSELKDHYSLYIQPTYVINKDSAMFAKIGRHFAKADLSFLLETNGGGTQSNSGSQNIEGWGYGLGFKNFLSNNLFFQAEAGIVDYEKRNFFENHTTFGTPTPRASIKPETMNATISFGYKF